MSRDQYSRMWQQLCGVNNFCDARGSIYPKIKIIAVWRPITPALQSPTANWLLVLQTPGILHD